MGILIRGQRFQDWVGRDKVPWGALRVRMNRDNGSVWSGKSFSSRPLQVYSLPTLQRKRKKEKVNVNHETATRTNIHIYLELSRLTSDNRLLSSHRLCRPHDTSAFLVLSRLPRPTRGGLKRRFIRSHNLGAGPTALVLTTAHPRHVCSINWPLRQPGNVTIHQNENIAAPFLDPNM